MKPMFKMPNPDTRVKAGALQLTMYVVVVIALLLAGFILYIHTHEQFKIQTQYVKETIANTDRGIDHALKNKLIKNDTLTVKIPEQDYQTLKVHKDYWGLFEKVTSISRTKQNQFGKIALVGTAQATTERTVLYVKDNNRPLVVVGNTHIEGMAYLPKQGIKTGNIAGHSYYGKALVHGKVKNSRPNLPSLSKAPITAQEALKRTIETAHPDQFIDISTQREFQNSFYDPLQIVYSPNGLLLSGTTLTGHILVRSDTKIVVEATTTLQDVILMAPEIEIRPHTKGVFQAMADKHMTIGNHCTLDYPSILYIKDKQQASKTVTHEITSGITIGKGTKVKGIVAYLGDTKNYRPQIKIGEGAEVMGEVYCDKNLELSGTVRGSVMTSNFVANQSGSAYQNHIYNGTINIHNLTEAYVGLIFENQRKGIAKWLY